MDHGQGKIVPVNVLLTVAAIVLWWPFAPWWLLVIGAILAIVFTGDAHSCGMYIVLGVTALIVIVGIVIRVFY